ncbi:MAG: DUF5318 domain-containing protein [Actinomycetota bacterium]|nr:DUF5318 domain-containing protein [Actinomycetota bacterium]
MTSQRSVIDYSLARRATLTDLFAGRASADDVCDAHPYLLRAAKHHGERTDSSCPVCRKQPLTHVTYVYGDELKEYSGRVKSSRELAEMAREHSEFTVYVVEVCTGCSWNHLRTSYVLGEASPPPQRAAGRRSTRPR